MKIIVGSRGSQLALTQTKLIVNELSKLNPNVDFEIKDISKDREAAMFLVKKTKKMAVPVIQIGEEFIVGYAPDNIKAQLQLQRIIK